MGYVPIVDNFTDEEHKLFLACLVPVEGTRRRRKFNHTGWLLWNKTHTDMLNHFYMWKYEEGVQSHPSHKEWEAAEECKENRHAKAATRPSKILRSRLSQQLVLKVNHSTCSRDLRLWLDPG